MLETTKFPVYVILTHSGTVLSNMIQHVTKNPYSHSSISFSSDLHHMYSFGRKYANNPMIGAFVKEDITAGLFKNVQDTAKYSIYVTFVTAEERKLMLQKLSHFQNNSSKYKYDFSGLFKHALGIESERDNAYFCSGFVATILTSGKDYFGDKHYSLVKPYEFAKHKHFHFVTRGFLKNYDRVKVDYKTKEIMHRVK